MTSKDYVAMIERARKASDLADDDCDMFGS